MAELTEISHGQQSAGAREVESFRSTMNSLFTTLESEVHSSLSRSHGAWHSALQKVQSDLMLTQAEIGRQLDLMNQAMLQASSTYARFDDQSQEAMTSAQGRVGSATMANLTGGIFANL